MSKESEQVPEAPRKFKLGPLGNLNQVMVALGKTIRAMADSTLSSWLSHLQRAGHHAPMPGDANTRSTWRAVRSVGRRERYGLWHHETRSAASRLALTS